jgi:hypothetical protein
LIFGSLCSSGTFGHDVSNRPDSGDLMRHLYLSHNLDDNISVTPRPDLEGISDRWRLGMSGADLAVFQALIEGALASYARVDELYAQQRPEAPSRESRPPDEDDNPLGAWYRRLVITDPRLAAGQASAIAGKPAVLATVRGGAYGAGTPREGWDHATPWMRRILEDVWGLDLRAVEEELALVGVNPALDQFAELAETMRAEAAALATEHGRSLAAALRSAA